MRVYAALPGAIHRRLQARHVAPNGGHHQERQQAEHEVDKRQQRQIVVESARVPASGNLNHGHENLRPCDPGEPWDTRTGAKFQLFDTILASLKWTRTV